MAKSLRLNERIRVSPVRLINQHQEQLGVVSIDEALSLARDAGLDLVEVSPAETPPVCRIINYGKHLYERKKRLKMSAQAHTTTIKEIRLRPKTGEHDREIKMNRARGFLEEGHKVQFTMLFRGRERFFKERANSIFHGIVEEFGEMVKVERPPMVDGRRMTMVVAPVKKKSGGQSQSSGSSKATKAAPKQPPKQAVVPPPAASSDSAESASPPVASSSGTESPPAPVVPPVSPSSGAESTPPPASPS